MDRLPSSVKGDELVQLYLALYEYVRVTARYSQYSLKQVT
jgi:hypothetical protein